jgi:RNA polymerase sigma-70 factor, ECF subfamily
MHVAGPRSFCSTCSVTASSRPIRLADAPEPSSSSVSRESVDHLVRTHSAYVARLAYRLLARDHEVDDVMQDVFFAFLRYHTQIRDVGAVRAWLATTTVRFARKRLRARNRPWLSLNPDVPGHDPPAREASPEDHAALARVHRALEGVSANARVAWVLRYLEQERIEDVARLCGCSSATAKRRIAAAHHVVRKAILDD